MNDIKSIVSRKLDSARHERDFVASNATRSFYAGKVEALEDILDVLLA